MSQKRIKSLLQDKRFKGDHYNNLEKINWICSTGSLQLDLFLDGGIRPGVLRLSGEPEGGKTSFALSVARIFQETIENGFVFYINAEGRLTDELIKRSGLSTDEDKWCCLDSNILETSLGMIRELIAENGKGEDKDRYRYLFIVDSTDALIKKADFSKSFEDGQKVAGSAVIFSHMGKATSLPLTKNGHALMVLSQTRHKMAMGMGGASAGTTQSGGKALNFYSSVIAEIKPLWTNLYIWENPSGASIDAKGKRIGHQFVLKFTKTRNEKTGQIVEIPIKYGTKGEGAIWTEHEVMNLCLQFEFLHKKNAGWFEFDAELIEEAEEIEIKPKHQGLNNLIKYLEENEEITQFLVKKFRQLL
jgi:RecA/RadA recombinase